MELDFAHERQVLLGVIDASFRGGILESSWTVVIYDNRYLSSEEGWHIPRLAPSAGFN